MLSFYHQAHPGGPQATGLLTTGYVLGTGVQIIFVSSFGGVSSHWHEY
jgi:hypothetical protein